MVALTMGLAQPRTRRAKVREDHDAGAICAGADKDSCYVPPVRV